MCPFLLWKASVVDGSCCGWLQQYTFEKSSRCSCPAFISPIPKPFALSGYFLNLCLPYTQSHFSAWVYSLISSSLYLSFSLFWVFLLLLLSIYPKIFLSMGILIAFCFSIPKDFSFHGYSYCFCFLYTQRFSLPWVFLLLFASLYPKLFFSLGIYLTFVSDIPKLLYSSEYNRCFSFHRTSFMSSITQPSFSM